MAIMNTMNNNLNEILVPGITPTDMNEISNTDAPITSSCVINNSTPNNNICNLSLLGRYKFDDNCKRVLHKLIKTSEFRIKKSHPQ